MDSRLLTHYNRELLHLRETAAEFAREFPKIAGRLALDEFACADPYVERLLEGFAFMAARVQLKLEAEFPRFTQNLLQTVYPHYLCPTPSMAMVQMEPDYSEGSLVEGFVVPRGSSMKSMLGKGDRTACEYRTAHDVTLLPLQITEATYLTRELSAFRLPEGLDGIKAALRIRIKTPLTVPLEKLNLNTLNLHITGAPEIQMRLLAQVIGRAKHVLVQPPTTQPKWRHVIPAAQGVQQVGFSDSQALLPYGPRSFQGYRLLHEYFSFPQRYLFFELTGLAPAMKRCTDLTSVDILILMREADLALENMVDASNFTLFCTPAINLFPKRAGRIEVSDRFSEFHVVPDRTRPRDFEIYEIEAVTGFGTRSDQEQRFQPFYAARDPDQDAGAYFTTNRLPRVDSENEQRTGRRSRYAGSEVYVSLVDARSAPYASGLRQLGVETLCTNRDLPLFMPIGHGTEDFKLDAGAPVQSIRCIGGKPSPPRASFAEGETAWRLISHLSLNYLSITNSGDGQGAGALRELLQIYGDLADAHVRKQIEGVKSVMSEPIVRRVAAPGPIAFARGVQVAVTLEEAAFEGTGVFLLGMVLEQFFAKYVSMNSFTETVLKTTERDEIMRWPARFGQRVLL